MQDQLLHDTSILVQSVSKNFQSNGNEIEVISNISLHLNKGEIVCILGKSGCGKTTLLNLMCGLDKPSQGTVSVNGLISYIPQKDLLLPWRTVMENILLPLEIKEDITKECISEARKFIKELNLENFSNSFPNEISGGMKQKVALIRSFIQNTNIIFFDEALSAIDFDSRLLLEKRIRSHIINSKKSAIFVTHNIEEAISVADRIIILSARSAKIISEIVVDISEEDRNPVELRKTAKFQRLFESIWKTMRYKI